MGLHRLSNHQERNAMNSPEIDPEILEAARAMGAVALTDCMDVEQLDVYVDLPGEVMDCLSDLCRAWALLINESLPDDYSLEEVRGWVANGSLMAASAGPVLTACALRSLKELYEGCAGLDPQTGNIYLVHSYLQDVREGLWGAAEVLLDYNAGPKAAEPCRKAFSGVLLMIWSSLVSGSDALAVLRGAV